MASITKRGDSWRAQVKHKGERATKTFRLKAQAVAWAHEMEAALTDTALNGERHTVRDALHRYGEEESPKKKGSRWELVRLEKFKRTLPFIDVQLLDLEAAAVASWRDSQTTSPGTVRREMNLLMSVMEVALKEWGWLKANPLKAVRKPPSPRPRDAIYTDAQIDAICEELTGPLEKQVAIVFRLAVETAMRSGEIISLTRDQVDLARRVVHLDKTKNGDKRDVPLSLAAVHLLSWVDSLSGGQPLFELTDQTRDVLFRKARDAAGVKGLTFHDARATALTRLARKVDVLTLARIAGHRDLKSLQIYYRESAEDIALRL